MSKVRSIKGVFVDFDLIRIKQQIAAQPAPLNVREREAFIDGKIRRRSKKPKTKPVNLDIDIEIAQEQESDGNKPIIPDVPIDDVKNNESDDTNAQSEDESPDTKEPRKVRKK